MLMNFQVKNRPADRHSCTAILSQDMGFPQDEEGVSGEQTHGWGSYSICCVSPSLLGSTVLTHEPHRPHRGDQTRICKLTTKPKQVMVSEPASNPNVGRGDFQSARVWLCGWTGAAAYPKGRGGPDLRGSRCRIMGHQQGYGNVASWQRDRVGATSWG